MDEQAAIDLLTRLIAKFVSKHFVSATLPADFPQNVANASWDALILLMRQTLATEHAVILRDLGVFERSADTWNFVPAASLTEVAALKVSVAEGHAQIAAMAVFHLENATRLLNNLPREVRVKTSAPSILELLADDTYERAIGDVLRDFSGRLQAKADDLESSERRTIQTSMLPAKAATSWVIPKFTVEPLQIRADESVDQSSE